MEKTWWKRGHRQKEEGEYGDDRSSFVLTSDDLEPIDTQEQEEMIRSFEKKHAHQNLLWRRVFAGITLGYVAFLIYSIFHQAYSPWGLRYHAYFMDEIHPWMVISAASGSRVLALYLLPAGFVLVIPEDNILVWKRIDWIAVLACLLAVKGLLQNSEFYQQWLWYSCYVGLFLVVFWLYYMLRLPSFRWDIIWLPFGPLSGAGISLYVDHLLRGSLEDIEELRSRMYNYKAM